jgi:hypothetical protein
MQRSHYRASTVDGGDLSGGGGLLGRLGAGRRRRRASCDGGGDRVCRAGCGGGGGSGGAEGCGGSCGAAVVLEGRRVRGLRRFWRSASAASEVLEGTFRFFLEGRSYFLRVVRRR